MILTTTVIIKSAFRIADSALMDRLTPHGQGGKHHDEDDYQVHP